MREEMCNDNHEIAEYIASKLPISSEDALDFIEGAIKGGMFTEKINYSIALGCRDRIIEQMQKEINYLRDILDNNGSF